ncbi:MAG: CBS domain-containing protein [bacterium]|nr:CBS domain-containing protein [bacterium]
MQIRSLVGGTAQLCGMTTSLTDAARSMIEEATGSLGVIEGGHLAGIVTERDVLRAASRGADLGTEAVADWMTPDPDTVGPDIAVDEVAQWMLAAGYRHLPVMQEGELLGIASIKDVLWALHSEANDPKVVEHLPTNS